MSDDSGTWWDEPYDSDDVPWDTGSPQSAIVELAECGAIAGDVLDIGCGLGTHARFLAARGHRVTGIDVSRVAIERARAATTTDLPVTFRVADAFDLDEEFGPFETVLDVGVFHAFDGAERSAYADALRSVTAAGSVAIVLSFGADAPPEMPPNRIDRDRVAAAFDDGWRVEAVRTAPFETTHGAVPGCLATIERR